MEAFLTFITQKSISLTQETTRSNQNLKSKIIKIEIFINKTFIKFEKIIFYSHVMC